ncbi:hypothetical protein ACWPKO_03125 [Coraliomargarita sp. W4R53]
MKKTLNVFRWIFMLPAPAFFALAIAAFINMTFAESEKFEGSLVGPSVAGLVAPLIYLPLVAVVAPKWKEKIIFTLAEFGIAGLVLKAFVALNSAEVSSMLGWDLPILLTAALGIIGGGIAGIAIARKMEVEPDGTGQPM